MFIDGYGRNETSLSVVIGILLQSTARYNRVKQHRPWLVLGWVTISMSISVDSPLDETLNRGPLVLLLRRQYEFPFGINIVKFSSFFVDEKTCLGAWDRFVRFNW